MDKSKAISSSRSSQKWHTCEYCSNSPQFRTEGVLALHQRCFHAREIGTKEEMKREAISNSQSSKKWTKEAIAHLQMEMKLNMKMEKEGEIDHSKAISISISRKKLYTCESCQACFLTMRALDEHCSRIHPSSENESMSLAELGSRYTCESCQACFSTKGALAEHWISKHPLWENNSMLLAELGHACPFCEMCFLTSEALDRHFSSSGHHPSIIATLSAVKIGQEDEDNENEEDGKEIWLTDTNAVNCFRLYAEAALKHYNNQHVGKRYALVEHGPATSMGPTGMICHLNFKAREEDCPSAQVETFFAQLTFPPYNRVDCCVSLGPSNKLPHWRKAELGGCQFCHGVINHPTEPVANLILENY